jgi:hypothetical protein
MEKYLDQFTTFSIFTRFFDRSDFFCKKMFGGLACYLNGRMIALIMESDLSDRTYRGKKYHFPIWYGILIPTEWWHQPSLKIDLPGAVSHPVLGKWLYLCIENDQFDESVQILIRLLSACDERLGILPKAKKYKDKKPKAKNKTKKNKVLKMPKKQSQFKQKRISRTKTNNRKSTKPWIKITKP